MTRGTIRLSILCLRAVSSSTLQSTTSVPKSDLDSVSTSRFSVWTDAVISIWIICESCSQRGEGGLTVLLVHHGDEMYVVQSAKMEHKQAVVA